MRPEETLTDSLAQGRLVRRMRDNVTACPNLRTRFRNLRAEGLSPPAEEAGEELLSDRMVGEPVFGLGEAVPFLGEDDISLMQAAPLHCGGDDVALREYALSHSCRQELARSFFAATPNAGAFLAPLLPWRSSCCMSAAEI